MMTRLLHFAVAAAFSLVLASCEIFSESEEERIARERQEEANYQRELNKPLSFVVSVHSILKYAENPDKELLVTDFFSNSKTLVEKTPWLTSKYIEDITPRQRTVDAVGAYDLVLTLTPDGLKIWNKMLKEQSDEGFAFLVDGILFQTFQPTKVYHKNVERQVVVEGPFDELIAADLANRAPFNYLKLKTSK